MDDGVAIATRKGSDGDLVISCRLEPDGWKVSDLAVESKTIGKHIPSVAKLANVVRTTGSFLSAYARADKATLKNVSTPKFFSRSLAPADLSLVPLPAELDAGGDYEVTLRGRQADLIIRGESNVTKIGLMREQDEDNPDQPARFAVNDVTIYELENRQEKRLSALFTAHATMHVFSQALRQGDLSMIRKTSSVDFNKRVWRHVDEKLLSQMPLREVEDV